MASLEKMNFILQHAILHTKYSGLVHLDVHSIPSNTETRVSELKWMNEQSKKAGLTFFNHDNTYAVLSDAPLSYRAKPSYTPTDAKSVVICAPRSIRFRDINRELHFSVPSPPSNHWNPPQVPNDTNTLKHSFKNWDPAS